MTSRPTADPDRVQVALDDIVPFALALPEVVESTCYGQPAVKRGGKLIFTLRKDLETLALVCGFEEREVLMKEDPETFFITDHYRNHPSVLVRLARVRKMHLRKVVKAAWDRLGGRAGKPPARRAGRTTVAR